MASLLRKAMKLVLADDSAASLLRVSKKERRLQTLTERELIQLESQIGREVFGPVPKNVVRREFFNLDEKTWIWHEEIKHENGTKEELTTRYEVQNRGVLKVQPGPRYSYLEGQELQNFVLAVSHYYERVARGLYRRDPSTGKSLVK